MKCKSNATTVSSSILASGQLASLWSWSFRLSIAYTNPKVFGSFGGLGAFASQPGIDCRSSSITSGTFSLSIIVNFSPFFFAFSQLGGGGRTHDTSIFQVFASSTSSSSIAFACGIGCQPYSKISSTHIPSQPGKASKKIYILVGKVKWQTLTSSSVFSYTSMILLSLI